MDRTVISLAAVALAIGIANAASTTAIRSVKLDHPSLNVAGREVVTLTVDFAKAGTVNIAVLDRDGYAVRTLAKTQPVSGGMMSFGWDGRDDHGGLVPDEAYSFKIDWRGAADTDGYFPADTPQLMRAIDVRSYDRRSATLSYTLPQPSRVHIQAGTAVWDSKTKQPVGPVMKTIVNREPRAGGSIAEHWSGYDESGAIYIPDLENFVVAIAATPLPENSVITFGNRQRRFVDSLTSRHGASLFTSRTRYEHHAGLAAKDDVSPTLRIEAINATWSFSDRRWILKGEGSLQLRLSVEGPTAAAFRTHPATIELFVDGRRVGEATRKKGDVVAIPIDSTGNHRVSVNWNSEWGPVAANTIQVHVGGSETAAGGTR
jgi:hypothetical protein